MIRDIHIDDAPLICEIYNHYVEGSIITFEEQPVSHSAMAGRISDVTARFPWIVYEDRGAILGYSFATQWKGRCAYRYSAETTVYVAPSATGKGIGIRLYSDLIFRLRGYDFHSLMGGIALPNAASVGLHEKMGFAKVAHFEEVGWKLDRWIDVGYWQKILPSEASQCDAPAGREEL